MMKKQTYEQRMHCENCGNSYVKNFAMGEKCAGYHTCPNCGCRDAKAGGMPIQYSQTKI